MTSNPSTSGGTAPLDHKYSNITIMSDIQDRIAAARREAEGLKAKIKIKKEELADADCEHNMRTDIQKRTKF